MAGPALAESDTATWRRIAELVNGLCQYYTQMESDAVPDRARENELVERLDPYVRLLARRVIGRSDWPREIGNVREEAVGVLAQECWVALMPLIRRGQVRWVEPAVG